MAMRTSRGCSRPRSRYVQGVATPEEGQLWHLTSDGEPELVLVAERHDEYRNAVAVRTLGLISSDVRVRLIFTSEDDDFVPWTDAAREAAVTRTGQVWEVPRAGNGPWLIVGWTPDLFDIPSWEIVSLTTLQRGRALESRLIAAERDLRDPTNGWERLL